MSRVVPSVARSTVERIKPGIGDEAARMKNSRTTELKLIVRAITDIVNEIPSELIVLSHDDFALFTTAMSIMSQALEIETTAGAEYAVMPVLPMFGNRAAIKVVYDLLGRCPDQVAKPGSTELEFVDDVVLRADLRIDISAASDSLMSHDYKAATVIAGSVAEALLLWALDRKGVSVGSVVWPSTITRPKGPVEDWNFVALIEAANQLALIGDNTRKQADLTRDFRNLIHPGRSRRLQEKCTKGTAYAALAAVEQIAADLQRTCR
jgi:hypothetical protein